MTMSPAEIGAMLAETGIYIDPDHPEYIEEKKRTEGTLPFLEYDIDPQHLYADGEIYFTYHEVEVRLYTDRKVDEWVLKVRQVLRQHGIKYKEKGELQGASLIWLTTFTMEA